MAQAAQLMKPYSLSHGPSHPLSPALTPKAPAHHSQALGTQAWGFRDPPPPFAWSQGVTMEDPEALLTITVQCAFTLTLKAPRGADLSSLRALLSQALPLQAQCGQLSYRDPGDGHWVPLPEEEALQRAWWDAGSGPTGLQLQCRVSLGMVWAGAGQP